MKKFKSIILTVALSLVFFACEQEVAEFKPMFITHHLLLDKVVVRTLVSLYQLVELM